MSFNEIPTASPQSILRPPFLVEITQVTKAFGSKAALSGVSWQLPYGEISALLGPNGAGKTTLFRLLMGILKPTSGSICIAGHDAFEDRVALKRLIGYLPDEPMFYSYMSGREILQLSAGMHGLHVDDTMRKLMPLIERVGLKDSINAFAEEYSRGMKKKLGLLLALLHEPSFLILDEPTNGLDVDATRLFFDLMRELANAGKTIVFSTHLLDQVERLCSRAAIISKGSVLAMGSLDELRGSHASLEDAFVALTHDASAQLVESPTHT